MDKIYSFAIAMRNQHNQKLVPFSWLRLTGGFAQAFFRSQP
ncbi:hypothetical protein [Falsiroseomonas sp. E2-1-a20]